MKLFDRLISSDRGASMVEYALMVALVAVISVPAVSMAGHRTGDTFNTVGETLALGVTAESGGVGVPTEDPTSNGGQDDPGLGDSGQDGATGPDDSNSDQSDSGGDKECDNGKNGHNGLCDNEKNCNNQNVGNNGQNCDEDPYGGDDPVDDAVPTTPAAVSTTGSEFSWWEDTKHGGEGEWAASFELENTSGGDQHLTIEVTQVDEKGKTKTTTVDGFFVPAGGTATYQSSGNDYEIKNGKTKGILSVEIRVVAVTTTDAGGQQTSYEIEEPSTATVAPPTR